MPSQGAADLFEDRHRPIGLERTDSVDQLGDVVALDVAHVDEQVAVEFSEPMDRHDVRVA